MKKIVLVLLIFNFCILNAICQSDNDEYQVLDHVWYGVNIGNIGLNNHAFSAGVAPMAGYKFSRYFSVGAIVKLNYSYLWQSNGLEDRHFVDYGFGALARSNIFRNYFLQVEYDKMNISAPTINILNQDREWLPFVYVGGGIFYPGTSRWSTEFTVLVNLHPDSNEVIYPISGSFAFLYNLW